MFCAFMTSLKVPSPFLATSRYFLMVELACSPSKVEEDSVSLLALLDVIWIRSVYRSLSKILLIGGADFQVLPSEAFYHPPRSLCLDIYRFDSFSLRKDESYSIALGPNSSPPKAEEENVHEKNLFILVQKPSKKMNAL